MNLDAFPRCPCEEPRSLATRRRESDRREGETYSINNLVTIIIKKVITLGILVSRQHTMIRLITVDDLARQW